MFKSTILIHLITPCHVKVLRVPIGWLRVSCVLLPTVLALKCWQLQQSVLITLLFNLQTRLLFSMSPTCVVVIPYSSKLGTGLWIGKMTHTLMVLLSCYRTWLTLLVISCTIDNRLLTCINRLDTLLVREGHLLLVREVQTIDTCLLLGACSVHLEHLAQSDYALSRDSSLDKVQAVQSVLESHLGD